MKTFLMYKDDNFNLERELPWNEKDLVKDLELNTLFDAMARGDDFLLEVAKKVILCGENDLETILYRQNILKDCLKNSEIIREMYNLAVEALEKKKKSIYFLFSKYPSSTLYSSIKLMKMLIKILERIKTIADEHADKFSSGGFNTFFATIKSEANDQFFRRAREHLRELEFEKGILISARLGKGNEGTGYILRRPNENQESWMKRIFAKQPPVYSFQISNRDDSGAKALSEIKNRGINLVADTLAQSAEHILNFFEMLRTELAFYIGCLNLYEQLEELGEPITFPNPTPSDTLHLSFKGLYDACLALTSGQKVVGNDLQGDEKNLIIITGANQGGKTTFLRSIGLAQLMMQCGIFVPAEQFSSNICEGFYTHFKRKEDATMESGKFDEELKRMNDIANNIRPNSVILFNESFAATNEREGSEISRQIIRALLEKHIKVFFVTHLYEFARSFFNRDMKNVLFLRAERKSDGKRTFKIIEGKPMQTSHGEDLYHQIFN